MKVDEMQDITNSGKWCEPCNTINTAPPQTEEKQITHITKGTKRDGENNIKRRIARSRQSFDEQVMMLAGGDVMQYEAIKKGSIGDYLIKLTNYVDGIERQINANKERK